MNHNLIFKLQQFVWDRFEMKKKNNFMSVLAHILLLVLLE